jgi:hypothetical protein
LKIFSRNKQSSLFSLFVTAKEKKFYYMDTRCLCEEKEIRVSERLFAIFKVSLFVLPGLMTLTTRAS